MKAAAALLLICVALAPAQPPTPESVLGHKPGDDFYLASYDDSLGYFQKLAQSTNKLKTTMHHDLFCVYHIQLFGQFPNK